MEGGEGFFRFCLFVVVVLGGRAAQANGLILTESFMLQVIITRAHQVNYKVKLCLWSDCYLINCCNAQKGWKMDGGRWSLFCRYGLVTCANSFSQTHCARTEGQTRVSFQSFPNLYLYFYITSENLYPMPDQLEVQVYIYH